MSVSLDIFKKICQINIYFFLENISDKNDTAFCQQGLPFISFNKNDETCEIVIYINDEWGTIDIDLRRKIDTTRTIFRIDKYLYDDEKKRFMISDDTKKMSEEIFDMLYSATQRNKSNVFCDYCIRPFDVENCKFGISCKKSKYISKCCDYCDMHILSQLQGKYYYHEDSLDHLKCDICYENFVETIEEGNKINFNYMYKLTCCREKHICEKCKIKNKLNNCPFCRQNQKTEPIIYIKGYYMV